MAHVLYSDRYPVYVDVSAKIDAWEKPSVIAVSNGHHRAMLVQPEVKAAAARLLGDVIPVQFALYALLAYLAVRPELDRVSSITLDQDYSGSVAERLIVRRLVELLRRDRPKLKVSAVRIAEVRGTRADRLAREVYKGMRQPDGVIGLAEIEAAIWWQKNGLG